MDAPANPPEQKPAPAFQFISQHFAAVSALVVVSAYFLAMVFLVAYLGFFDWRLVWIIEYPDVFKTGAIALAVMSSFVWFVYIVIDDVYLWTTEKTKSWNVAKISA